MFHTFYKTVVFILALATGNPVYLISIERAYGGCDRSAEDAYSSMAPDRTFAFLAGPCCPSLDFVFAFWIMITFDIVNFAILYSNPDPHGSPFSRLLRHARGCREPNLTRIFTSPPSVASYDTQGDSDNLFLPGTSREKETFIFGHQASKEYHSDSMHKYSEFDIKKTLGYYRNSLYLLVIRGPFYKRTYD
jgi:hypothetical protein